MALFLASDAGKHISGQALSVCGDSSALSSLILERSTAWPQHKAKSSSPAPSRARSIRPPCRRICRSRPTRSPKRRSARRRPARRSCTCTRAIRRTAARRRTRSCSRSSCRRSRRRSDVVINLTTGGAPTMSHRGAPAAGAAAQARGGLAQHGLDELRPVRDARPLQGIQARLGEALPRRLATSASSRTRSRTSPTSCESCADNGTRFEIECYDIGHLYTAAHFLDRGLVKPPLFIQSVFGIRGGIGPHPEDVMHMKRTADRLFGDAYLWSVLGRRPQPDVRSPRMSAVMGGNVRVGPGRQPVARAAARSRSPTPSRWRRCAASWRSSASRSPRRTRRARCSSSKAADNVGF